MLDLSLSLGAHNLRNSADTRTCLWTKLLIEKQICLQTGIDRPRVIALFGPTNAGKSTIVNLLLGQPLAPMSATARHTQHPTLFAANVHALASNELVHLSSGHSIITEVPTSLSDEALSRGEYQRTLRVVDVAPAHTKLADTVILDTPDFSTEAADAYLAEVFHASACADLLVCVVTPESYADAFGLDLLRTFAQSGKHMIVVGNKVPQQAGATDDMRALLQREIGMQHHHFVALPIAHGRDGQERVESLLASSACEDLVNALHASLPTSQSRFRQLRLHIDWVRSHLAEALAPVQAQIDTASRSKQAVSSLADASASHFAETYLTRDRYPEFDLAIVRVLRLLEVPVLGPALRLSNRIVRVPIKAVGKALGFAQTSKRSIADDERDAIVRCALRSVDHMNARLREQYTANSSFATTAATLDEAWIRTRIESCLDTHHADVTHRIEARAQSLYEALKAKPKVLAALRASNALAGLGSAAAVVISHGLNWHDAVLAPVAVGVQQELLRHGLGVFVDQQRAKLKLEHQQLVASLVETSIVNELLAAIREPANQQDIDHTYATIDVLHARIHSEQGGAA
ncbi:MAG: 50S ribosome-binding GTPase [Phycisphaeraceae bacterium]|nr:50S ribosome-binding GTPase [Phycisphaerales bacterium]MCB9861585.1 50S ribosome-binding GTPase [Phycisphaeraceae bacterium]